MKRPVRQGWRASFGLRAAGMPHRFDVVQIEYSGVAYGRGLLPIGRTPEVLDDRDFVALAARGRGDLCAKAGEPVHEWRHAPRQAGGITRGAGERMARVWRQFHNVQAAHQAGGQMRAGVRGARIAEYDHIHRKTAGQEVEQRGAAHRASARQRVRGFGGDE